MIVISSREFRQNQKKYLEKVDEGEQVILLRGKDKAYSLAAVVEDDIYLNSKMVERIKKSMKEIESGDTVKISSSEEIRDLLGL